MIWDDLYEKGIECIFKNHTLPRGPEEVYPCERCDMKPICVGGIDCRSVGPGGTSVSFYPTREGIKCVWRNENCPYDFNGVEIDDETYEASDGHNVSMIPWETMDVIMNFRPKPHSPMGAGLHPQPKKQINKRKGR